MSLPIRFPAAVREGDTVAIVAPSSGVRAPLHARLDRALDRLRALGLRVVEGDSLRQQARGASADAASRAEAWQRAMVDAAIAAVLPPWGGERAIELLPRIDLSRIAAARPRWFGGFSDLSTLQLPLLLRAGVSSLHGPNLMELGAASLDATTACLPLFWQAAAGATITQSSSAMHQVVGADVSADPAAGLHLDTPTRVRRLDGRDAPVAMRGRLVGGCLDTLARLAGTPFGDVPGFVRRCAQAGDGAILFLENAEMQPFELARALQGVRLNGWFDGLAGVLLGRHAPAVGARPPASGFGFDDALAVALGDLPCPVLLDLDIGHVPPQWTLAQGALADVSYDGGACVITQRLA